MAAFRWDDSMRRCAATGIAVCACALAALPLSGFAEQLPGSPDAGLPPTEQVVDVQVTGNRVMTTQKVLADVKTHAGRPFDDKTVQDDVRRLYSSRKFLEVKPLIQQVPGGKLVVFEVVERPMAEEVVYVGNSNIKLKTLKDQTELDKGSPLDPYKINEGQRKIEQYYRDHGYNNVRVSVFEGTGPNDHRIVYLIDEGKSQKVWNVNFVGNTIASDGRLKTQIQSKPGILWLFGGNVDPKKISEDEDRLKAYYRSLGFFSAEVSRELSYNEAGTWLTLTFVINEGPRYMVRNVSFIGATKFTQPDLEKDLKLKGNQFFDQTAMNKDLGMLRDKYGGEGYVLADVQANPRFSEDQPGVLDVVYEIKEGQRYRVGSINVHITGDNPHTKQSTVYNRISLRPGDIVDTKQLRDSTRRLQFSQLFLVDRQSGQIPKIVFTPPDKDKDSSDGETKDVAAGPKSGGSYRGQSPDYVPGRPAYVPPPAPWLAAPARNEPDQLLDIAVDVDEHGNVLGAEMTGRPK